MGQHAIKLAEWINRGRLPFVSYRATVRGDDFAAKSDRTLRHLAADTAIAHDPDCLPQQLAVR